MNRLTRKLWLSAVLALLAAPAASVADERRVAPPEEEQPRTLLLPAVQKAQSDDPDTAQQSAPRSVQPAPQRGIEPDEINVAPPQRAGSASPPARGLERRSPPAARGAQRASVQQMMLELQPPQPTAVTPRTGGSGPASVQAKPPEPPKYEIADCGTTTSPMICCHHKEGDGSSCNLFKILCKNAGGTAHGDGESAACSDW